MFVVRAKLLVKFNRMSLSCRGKVKGGGESGLYLARRRRCLCLISHLSPLPSSPKKSNFALSQPVSQVVKKERFESQIPEMSVSLRRTGNGPFCARYYLGC